MPRKIEISHKTIVFSVLFLLGLWFLYYIRDILLELFVSLLLMTILEPVVDRLSKVKIPRAVSILLSYILFFGVFGGAIALIIPALVEQTTKLVLQLPTYVGNLGIDQSISEGVASEFLVRLGSLPGEIIKVTFSIFSNLLSVLTVLVFAFYMLLARGKLDELLVPFFGEEKKKEMVAFIVELETRLGGWARGQFSLMLLIGVCTYVGLLVLGIPFALPLAILAGVLELIPYLGPIIAAIPSILIGFSISPVTGAGVAVLAFLIQQLENYVFVPKIMEKSVGVSPLVTLIALSIGARLAGIVGIIISVPTVIALQVLTKRYFVKD